MSVYPRDDWYDEHVVIPPDEVPFIPDDDDGFSCGAGLLEEN